MSKILRQNVGGVDFTVVGCALTGVCPTSAADYVKQITLSDGDVIEDGMMMVVTFANGNSAGNAPGTRTIYSSDQVNYYEDAQLTVPFTLAPEGCYDIEYTGTANAYTYTDYPVFQVGSVSGPVCDYRGHITSGDLWNAGDSVQCMLKEGKFLLLGGSGGTDIDVYNNMTELIADLPNLQDGQFAATKDTGDELAQPVDTVQAGNLHAVTSNAVAASLAKKLPVLLFNMQNYTGDIKYYKVNDIFPNVESEVVYFMQARAGELIVISAGYGDVGSYATPKAKRLLNTYSKISGLRYNGDVLYFALEGYSHQVLLTKMSGTWDLSRTSASVSEVSASEYNAATAITIET